MITDTNRKAFILFPDTWLSYTPSIINLVKVMNENGWTVTVLAFDDGSYHKTSEIEVLYASLPKSGRRIIRILKLFSIYRFFSLSFHVLRLRKKNFAAVIGVDSLGYLIARLFFRNPVYFSLHIRNSLSAFVCKKLEIKNMVIQTQERLDQTFDKSSYRPVNVWFIQNSPIVDRDKPKSSRRNDQGFRIVYFGNVAKDAYGIENCIDALRHVADDITLTMKGPVSAEYRKELESSYGDLVSSGRLSFDSSYIPQDSVIDWLEGFDLGFCFYDEGRIRRGDPNMVSPPSGKLFNYLAAGLPVIGSKLSGLKIVTEFGAGILLDHQDPVLIGAAVTEIRGSQKKYRQRTMQAALENDFRAMAERFLGDLADPLKVL